MLRDLCMQCYMVKLRFLAGGMAINTTKAELGPAEQSFLKPLKEHPGLTSVLITFIIVMTTVGTFGNGIVSIQFL